MADTRYEEKPKGAETRDEIAQIALQWEYSLMLRMLGPHQGIRLERLRVELDDALAKIEGKIKSFHQLRKSESVAY